MQPSPLLIIVRGGFGTVEADLSGQDKDCMAFYRKSLLTPALKCASELPHLGGKETGVSIPNLFSLQG